MKKRFTLLEHLGELGVDRLELTLCRPDVDSLPRRLGDFTAVMRSHPAYEAALERLQQALDALRNSSRETATDAVAAFETIQAEVGEELAAAIPLPNVVLPEQDYDPSRAPKPLFSCAADYLESTRRLIDHKALNGDHQ
jgi:hypothetical protein